ncbi:MAG: imidazole glycerol phosphate synthase subunit HisH [Candidatus Nitrosocaldaceae archaeon]|nr:MAG: imidazole glycerol phosphate synthase subunit HisH [Candidatus Nitrosocaldaceae archaeon]
MILIFDYGAGNLFSLKCSVEKFYPNVKVVNKLEEKFDGLILPGVGNFDPAMRSIRKYKKVIDEAIRSDIPILGICLGMEMLFNKSQEGKLKGLSILDGEVVMLPKSKVKIPHMGWNNLKIDKSSKLLKGLKDNSWFYFVHSYRVKPKDKSIIVGEAEYGIKVPAVIEDRYLFGTQFHPEKSGDNGEVILKNFVELIE